MMMADGLDAGSGDVCGVAPWPSAAVRFRCDRAVPDYYGPPAPVCRALLSWRGPMRRADGTPSFPTYSFYNLFYSQQQVLEQVEPELPPETFRGKIVVVGVAAEGLRDVFVTPFAEGRMPGAEVHANAIDAWRAGRTLAPLSPGRAALVAVGLALVVVRGRRRRLGLDHRRRRARAGARATCGSTSGSSRPGRGGRWPCR